MLHELRQIELPVFSLAGIDCEITGLNTVTVSLDTEMATLSGACTLSSQGEPVTGFGLVSIREPIVGVSGEMEVVAYDVEITPKGSGYSIAFSISVETLESMTGI